MSSVPADVTQEPCVPSFGGRREPKHTTIIAGNKQVVRLTKVYRFIITITTLIYNF